MNWIQTWDSSLKVMECLQPDTEPALEAELNMHCASSGNSPKCAGTFIFMYSINSALILFSYT